MRQAERRDQKLKVLTPIYDMIRQMGVQVRLNHLWDKKDVYKVKGVWNSRAYFLQDLKKYVPEDIEIHMAQRGGTFAQHKG